MSTNRNRATTGDSSDPQSDHIIQDLNAEIELLQEENKRLREEYARARRTQYRRSALGLGVIGIIGLLGGVVFPAARTVLIALGATGLFAAVLTYYLTPEQFIAAEVSERVYTTLAENGSALVDELGLQDIRVYVPRDTSEMSNGGGSQHVSLFVPQHTEYELPDPGKLGTGFVIPEEDRKRGLSFRPTGDLLVIEFHRALTGDLADDPVALTEQLVDGLTEQFELLTTATIDIDPEAGRVSIGVSGSVYGAVNRFDHPVVSFLAVGLARGLHRPITVDVTSLSDGTTDFLITCRWDND